VFHAVERLRILREGRPGLVTEWLRSFVGPLRQLIGDHRPLIESTMQTVGTEAGWKSYLPPAMGSALAAGGRRRPHPK
jgi:hypothetical protein